MFKKFPAAVVSLMLAFLFAAPRRNRKTNAPSILVLPLTP